MSEKNEKTVDTAAVSEATEEIVKEPVEEIVKEEKKAVKKESKCSAVIETGGKQYKVSKDDVIFVEKLDVQDDAEVEFDVVALISEDGIKTGAPFVEGAKVTGKVLKNGKAKKIYVSTYKPKKGEKRKLGHRQPYTKVEIKSIG